MAFPLTTLEDVEIVRGPGSVLYGTNAFTGVINLKTIVPDHNEFSISGMGGSHGYYESDVTAFGRAGDLGYVTAFRTDGQRGYLLIWLIHMVCTEMDVITTRITQ
jgi:outer membrane receptor protein involved in Fe transport